MLWGEYGIDFLSISSLVVDVGFVQEIKNFTALAPMNFSTS